MKQHKRHSGLFRGAVSVALSVIIPFTTMPEVALALPRGGHVTKGTATLSYATNKLLVNQSTSRTLPGGGERHAFRMKNNSDMVFVHVFSLKSTKI